MTNRLKNVGKASARVVGRGFGHMAAFVGKWIVMPVALMLALIWYGIPFLGEQLKDAVVGAKLPPRTELSAREEKCWYTAITDDSGDDIEAQVYIARVYKNSADELTGESRYCPTYENFRITMAPTQKPEEAKSPRGVDTMYRYHYLWRYDRQLSAKAIVQRAKQGDSTLWDEKAYPWLKCGKWITRAPRTFHAWEDNEKMNASTNVVFETKKGTKIRCLK